LNIASFSAPVWDVGTVLLGGTFGILRRLPMEVRDYYILFQYTKIPYFTLFYLNDFSKNNHLKAIIVQ
jgi:hypothetical protein